MVGSPCDEVGTLKKLLLSAVWVVAVLGIFYGILSGWFGKGPLWAPGLWLFLTVLTAVLGAGLLESAGEGVSEGRLDGLVIGAIRTGISGGVAGAVIGVVYGLVTGRTFVVLVGMVTCGLGGTLFGAILGTLWGIVRGGKRRRAGEVEAGQDEDGEGRPGA